VVRGIQIKGALDGIRVAATGTEIAIDKIYFKNCTKNIFASDGGFIFAYNATLTFEGNSTTGIDSNGGKINIEGGTTVTLVGTPAYAGSFLNGSRHGSILLQDITFVGSATGKRYSAYGESVLEYVDIGFNYLAESGLPGNATGTLASGAVFNDFSATDFKADNLEFFTFDCGASAAPPFTMSATHAGDSGPQFVIYHNSASPAAADFPAGIRFDGNDSGGNHTIYAAIHSQILDATNGSEDGSFEIYPTIAGVEDITLAAGFHLGMIVGAPTGSYKGTGTANFAGDIYKNNTAYTNPDYALESYFHGSIERYKDNEGAAEYQGLVSLDDLHQRLESDLRLPGIHDEPMGAFERTDKLLEKLEEAFIYITQLHERIAKLESR
jgi:HPt (histidine-containing phosphotransfer) domain-containing protein